MSTVDVSTALDALEALAASSATSSSGPLTRLLDEHFAVARERLLAGSPPKLVIAELQTNIARAKKDVEKGLKAWYSALGNVGKSVEKAFPPNLIAISNAYDDPALFVDDEAARALDGVVLESLGRRGLWDAVASFEDETGLEYDTAKRHLSQELHAIVHDIEAGDLASAIAWCDEPENKSFLAAAPHPSSLPYHLHRAVFLSKTNAADALAYARAHLFDYMATQPVLALVTSCLYSKAGGDDADAGDNPSPYANDPVPLAAMFVTDYCRRHGWAREDPLEVAVDLGSRGGALNAIEKARRVMGDRLGNVRTWEELPMEVPLPPTRRYHSVFVCPVSKEQTTDANPPKMLSCGHVIAQDSFKRMLKSSRRSAKCPYCPQDTADNAAQTLYF